MALIVLNELRLSALDMPYGARLCIQEIDREYAMALTRRHGVELPRPPPYKADRISEALEIPPPEIFRIRQGDRVLVCECPGFRAVLFYLVEFVGDLEEDEDEEDEVEDRTSDAPSPNLPPIEKDPFDPFGD